MSHVWTTPALQEESDVAAGGRVQVMCPACLRGATTAGPDVVRGSGHLHCSRASAWGRAPSEITGNRWGGSWGTSNTHALVDGNGLPVRLALSPG